MKYPFIIIMLFLAGCKITIPIKVQLPTETPIPVKQIPKTIEEANRQLIRDGQEKAIEDGKKPTLSVPVLNRKVKEIQRIDLFNIDINSEDYWLNDNKLEIKEGITVNAITNVVYEDFIKDSNVVYSSSDNTIAVVDQQGRITAKEIGNATITAVSKTDTSKKISLNLNVTDKITTIPKSPDLTNYDIKLSTVNLNWSLVEGAVVYKVYPEIDKQRNWIPYTGNNISSSSISFDTTAEKNIYYIEACNIRGCSIPTKVDIPVKKLQSGKIKGFTSGEPYSKYFVSLEWEPIPEATSYKLKVSYGSTYYDTLNLKNRTSYEYEISHPPDFGSYYYFTIIGCNDLVCSPETKESSVKVYTPQK